MLSHTLHFIPTHQRAACYFMQTVEVKQPNMSEPFRWIKWHPSVFKMRSKPLCEKKVGEIWLAPCVLCVSSSPSYFPSVWINSPYLWQEATTDCLFFHKPRRVTASALCDRIHPTLSARNGSFIFSWQRGRKLGMRWRLVVVCVKRPAVLTRLPRNNNNKMAPAGKSFALFMY